MKVIPHAPKGELSCACSCCVTEFPLSFPRDDVVRKGGMVESRCYVIGNTYRLYFLLLILSTSGLV